jgi:hypothetical protein
MENHKMMCKVYQKLHIVWAVLCGVFVNFTSYGGGYAKPLKERKFILHGFDILT